MHSPKRILVVGVNWLGDALLSTPAIRAIRRAHPDAHIECLVPARVRGVFNCNPHLNGVLVYDDRALILSARFWRTVFEVRQHRFDTAILLHGSRTKARLVSWAGIPHRWGVAKGGRNSFLTRIASPSPRSTHRAQSYLNLVGSFGIPSDGQRLDLIPEPSASASLKALLKKEGIAEGRPFAVLHGGGNWELKRWPVEHFRAWMELFLEARPDAVVVLCGTSNELEVARQIAEGFNPSRVVILTGKTTLDELAFLFQQALFVLSNDSGPIHVAASQGARIVGLYGPTAPSETGPWTHAPAEILWKDSGCEIPCYFRSCDHRVCLERLAPAAVLDACFRVLGAS